MHRRSYLGGALGALKPPQTFKLKQFCAQKSPQALVCQNISAHVDVLLICVTLKSFAELGTSIAAMS